MRKYSSKRANKRRHSDAEKRVGRHTLLDTPVSCMGCSLQAQDRMSHLMLQHFFMLGLQKMNVAGHSIDKAQLLHKFTYGLLLQNSSIICIRNCSL